MELGEKLRQARLEAGLSQRALCGDRITRNMLSQIENGSARPSMPTLAYLAGRLGKSVSYFLDGLTAEGDLLLQAHLRLLQAEQAMAEGRTLYAKELLKTPMEEELLELRRSWLLARLTPGDALPNLDELLYLKALSLHSRGDDRRALALLEGMEKQAPESLLLQGRIYLAQGDAARARPLLEGAEALPEALPLLEQCCSALGDYKAAYFYACKGRDQVSSK